MMISHDVILGAVLDSIIMHDDSSKLQEILDVERIDPHTLLHVCNGSPYCI